MLLLFQEYDLKVGINKAKRQDLLLLLGIAMQRIDHLNFFEIPDCAAMVGVLLFFYKYFAPKVLQNATDFQTQHINKISTSS